MPSEIRAVRELRAHTHCGEVSILRGAVPEKELQEGATRKSELGLATKSPADHYADCLPYEWTRASASSVMQLTAAAA